MQHDINSAINFQRLGNIMLNKREFGILLKFAKLITA